MVFLSFSQVFLRFSLDLCKGRISKNTLQISLTPAKILPLRIFSVLTPESVVLALVTFKSIFGSSGGRSRVPGQHWELFFEAGTFRTFRKNPRTNKDKRRNVSLQKQIRNSLKILILRFIRLQRMVKQNHDFAGTVHDYTIDFLSKKH